MTNFLTILTFVLWLAFSLAALANVVNFDYGSGANLDCTSPDPNFEIADCYWTKIKDDEITENITSFIKTSINCMLKFPSLEIHHEGIYTCVINSINGERIQSKLTNFCN